MSALQKFSDWVNSNPGKTLGGLGGFVLGLLLFTIGIWKTLIIVALAAAGFFLGKTRDDNISIIDQVTGLFKRKRDDEYDEYMDE